MSAPAADTRDDAAEQPPDETFWQTYNSRLEFPIAVLTTILNYTLLIAALVFLLRLGMPGGEDKTSVPIKLIEGGEDDAGLGMKDARGIAEPLTKGDDGGPTTEDVKALPLPAPLPEVQKEFSEKIKLDENLADQVVTAEKAAAYSGLAEVLRDKIMPVGQRQGNGGTQDGPAGIGSDATRARSLRWILRFKTQSGRDYLNQLSGLKAIVIVPVPPENKSAYVFHDLTNPKVGEMASEAEWHKLAQQIQFCDFKQDSVAQVSAELGLAQTKPHMFWAFFPKDLESRMAEMERNHQNRTADSIAETVFEVVQRNGRYELVVARQTLK